MFVRVCCLLQRMFAAVDCTEHTEICTKYDVSGYPTFKYMLYGKNAQAYNGGREEADFISFMSDPENAKKSSSLPPAAEDMWSDAEGSDNIIKLTAVDFDKFIQTNPSVLVMFYAPCKSSLLPQLCHVHVFITAF